MAENMDEMDLENYENMELEDFKPGDIKQARQKLMEMLNDGNLTDDMKENLKALLGGNMPVMGDNMDPTTGTYVALGLAGILFSVILFFGYKLYKSIKEKEKKREEKKKAKQMKKKK